MTMPPPVAFFIFARPDTTARVWAAIRRARPRRLLVVADAARPGRGDEAGRCAAARAVVKPDWPCRVQRLYASENMGCGRRIGSGLDWVFRQVPEAIILEDDCLPHPHFFRWARVMLARHRDNEAVMSISGAVLENGEAPGPHFSRYHFPWGWASWRRAWRHSDYSMRTWPGLARGPWLSQQMPNAKVTRYWRRKFQQTYEGRMDTWDYQWFFACLQLGGLSLIPPRSLISHFGTEYAVHPLARNMSLPTWPLNKSAFKDIPVRQDRLWDDTLEKKELSGDEFTLYERAWRKFRRVSGI